MLERFLAGRAEADFRVLYRRINPPLRAVARRLLGRFHLQTDDVVQEAWLRAMRVLARFERRSSFQSWLTGFVVNVCRETLKDARRGSARAAHLPRSTGSAPGPELSSWLDHALDDLPPRARTVVVLHDVAGFTHAEIAAILGVDEGTSKSQLSRARRRLRAQIDLKE